MKKQNTMLLIILLILIVPLGFFYWSGGFVNPKVEEVSSGPYIFIGIPHAGAYKNISAKFMEVEEKLKLISIEYDGMCGIYYDDPSKAPEDKLRSLAGILTSDEIARRIQIKFPEFKIIMIPNQQFIKSEFPFRNIISVILAVSKVYPKFNEYFTDRKFPNMGYKESEYEKNFALEIYHKDKIEFLMTIPNVK